jgi:uncharacterized protein YfaS (alpha-2-macroglobulin family)
VNYSRFEVGGERNYASGKNTQGLKSYLFTERGIYRPGDKVHIGAIVKHDGWQSVSGIPMELSIFNPRGQEVLKRKFTMDEHGLANIDFDTEYTSPTGSYTMSLSVVRETTDKDDDEDEDYDDYEDEDTSMHRQVGYTSFSVEEFKPDTMKIEAKLAGATASGWMLPDDLKLDVTLTNLFGRPAQDRRITWSYTVSPSAFRFSKYADYRFNDPYKDNYENHRYATVQLAEGRTSEAGLASQPIDLSQYAAGMFNMTAFAEGFEDGSGDSVKTMVSKYVSPLKYLIGSKTKGNLSYAKKGDKISVDFIAINPDLEQIDLNDLTYNIKEKRYVSLLVRQRDGTYAFQSVPKELDVKTGTLNVVKAGVNVSLPTNNPGNFYMDVTDNEGLRLARIEYFVAGAGNVTLDMDKNTELSLKLSKPEYKTGEEIELNIIAPYTGTGLITIEKDKVYAYKWFSTTTTSTRQTITVPADLEGNGYVNVSFVRSPTSEEIFSVPHTYAVAPFAVNRAAHETNVTIDVAKEAMPGMPLNINYTANKAGKIIVFAVDEGVLQVSNYKLPKPLDGFMRKRALQVYTYQVLDQLLTDASVMKRIAGVGGDGMSDEEAALAHQLNPFKRKTDAPVVYWSGILNVQANQRGRVTYNVPEYFNGTLRVMAVAVSNNSIGSTQQTMLVRAPIIVQPNMPLVLTPGDKAGMSITVSNNITGSGEADIEVTLKGDKYLSVAGEAKRTIRLKEGSEGRVDFDILANKELGSGTVNITASAPKYPKAKVDATATASVRPATAYSTVITMGASSGDNVQLKDFSRDMYPELADNSATASHSPLLVARGLSQYLKTYPHGCTEQVTSQAFPALKIRGTYWSEKEAQATFNNAVDTYRSRQQSSGGFSYWSDGWSRIDDYSSAYAMHYLTEAKIAGFAVPQDIFTNGQKWLAAYIKEKPTSLADARVKVYAAYILTRGGVVSSAFLANMEEYLEANHQGKWKSDIMAAFMAAMYKMMQSDEKASGLIKGYVPETKERFLFFSDFDSSSLRNSQYLYLMATHFADEIDKIDVQIVLNILASIEDQHYNSLLSSYSILALHAFADAAEEYDKGMKIFADDKELTIATTTPYTTADYKGKISKLVAQSTQAGKFGMFMVATESGFDLNMPSKTANGIEVSRTYTDKDGKVKTSFKQGEDVIVRINVRTNGNMSYIQNAVITDLLPGALEVQMDSITALRNSVYAGDYYDRELDYVDVREDRVLLYGPIDNSVSTYTYTARVVSRGEFVVPPVYAQSMYDPVYRGNSEGGKIVAEGRE